MYRSTSVGTGFLTIPWYVYRVSWCPIPDCAYGVSGRGGASGVYRTATVSQDLVQVNCKGSCCF